MIQTTLLEYKTAHQRQGLNSGEIVLWLSSSDKTRHQKCLDKRVLPHSWEVLSGERDFPAFWGFADWYITF